MQRLNDDQRGMSRPEDHIPTIPCGATICMADFRMHKSGLAVKFLIISQERKVGCEDETCAISILRQWRILKKYLGS